MKNIIIILIILFIYFYVCSYIKDNKGKEGFADINEISYRGNPYDYLYPQYLMGYNYKSYFPTDQNNNCIIPPKLDRKCYKKEIKKGLDSAIASHKCMIPAGITMQCLHQYYY